MEIEFNSFIFKPNSGIEFYKKRSSLVWWLVFLISILFLVLDMLYLSISIMLGMIFFSLFFSFMKINKKESLDGSFPIKLKITHDKLIIQNSHYKFSDIQLLKLTTDDYTNMPSVSYSHNTQYLSKSNGSHNHLWFINNGKKYKLRFRIDSLQHQRELVALKKYIGID